MKKKRPFTLLEIMVVIFLIGLIGSVIGYNMKGSLDKGKAFKTEQAMTQLKDLFDLKVAEGYSPDDIVDRSALYLKEAGISNPKNLLRDGWNKPFKITYGQRGFKIESSAYKSWKNKQKSLGLKQVEEEELIDEEEAALHST